MPGQPAPHPVEPVAEKGGMAALTLAGVAALLASTCCVLPLALAIVGVTGAWIRALRWLEPYSDALLVLALGALGAAGWQLWGRRQRSGSGAVCAADDAACRAAGTAMRRWFWVVALLTAVPLLLPLAAPLFY